MKLSKGIPGWIDFSPAMQRLTRNAIATLSDPGAIDELGIGIFRDSISNLLFPGTTVTMTRAVYLAFLPACMHQTEAWLYHEWEKSRISPSAERYQTRMRQFQNSFCKANLEKQGIIGRDNVSRRTAVGDDDDAHAYVVRYPFSIYWNALCRWNLIPGGRDENGNNPSIAAYIQKSCNFIHEHNDPEARWAEFDCGERKYADGRNKCVLFDSEQKLIIRQMIEALPDTLLGPMVRYGCDPGKHLHDSLTEDRIAGIPLDKISDEIRKAVQDMAFFTTFMRTAFSGYNALLNWDVHKQTFQESLSEFQNHYEQSDAQKHLANMQARVAVKNDTFAFLNAWLNSCFKYFPTKSVPDLELIANQEYAKKHGRAKIWNAWGKNRQNFALMNKLQWESRNSDFPVLKPEKGWIGMNILDYRWKETARLIHDLLENKYVGEVSSVKE